MYILPVHVGSDVVSEVLIAWVPPAHVIQQDQDQVGFRGDHSEEEGEVEEHRPWNRGQLFIFSFAIYVHVDCRLLLKASFRTSGNTQISKELTKFPRYDILSQSLHKIHQNIFEKDDHLSFRMKIHIVKNF